MSQLTSDIVIDAPAEQVWQVVAHRFDGIGDWATAVPASTSTVTANPPVGAPVAARVCRTGIRAVPQVTEEIIGYDEAARTLTYEATQGMPAFVSLARNTWRVTPVDSTRTLVAFEARLEVHGPLGRLGRRWLLAQARRTGQYVLADLKHYIEHGVPSPRKQHRAGRVARPTVADRAEVVDAVVAVGSRPSTRRLRAALRANAAFSMLSGATLAGFGWLVAAPWRLGPAVLPSLLGLTVAGFGVLLARLAVLPFGRLRGGTVAVLAADLGWLAGSGVLLAAYQPAAPGVFAVAAVAVAVAVLAGWQLAGLAGARGDDPFADVEVVEATEELEDPPAALWPLLTDHRLYG
ncbi:MAG TPA: SRPBCC family protein, partial [Kribbellaceae bacterium]|nr:SRPBCC family protein [Kribbellaceae bacterium]